MKCYTILKPDALVSKELNTGSAWAFNHLFSHRSKFKRHWKKGDSWSLNSPPQQHPHGQGIKIWALTTGLYLWRVKHPGVTGSPKGIFPGVSHEQSQWICLRTLTICLMIALNNRSQKGKMRCIQTTASLSDSPSWGKSRTTKALAWCMNPARVAFFPPSFRCPECREEQQR